MCVRTALLSTASITLLVLPHVNSAVAEPVYYDIGGLAPPAPNGTLAGFANGTGRLVVGNSYNGTFGEAFYWTPNGGMIGLGTLGGNGSSANRANADGSSIIGYANNGTVNEAFLWTLSGGMVGLGTAGGSTYATHISSDGSTIFGFHSVGLTSQPFRWTSSGNMTLLGNLSGGNYTMITAITPDGSAAVGQANYGFTSEAFMWTQAGGLVGLGTLGGISRASDISDDGTIVVGRTNVGFDPRAFRWTQGGGMVDLGTLGGSISTANAISADGSTIIGYAETGAAALEPFRWTQGGGMVSLGTLGGTNGEATAVSSNGSIIIGNSDNGITNEGFIWNQADGMRSITSILTAAGVDMTGWSTPQVTGVNADGTIITGSTILGTNKAFVISLSGPISFITTDELDRTLSTALIPSQQTTSLFSDGIGQSLLVARNALTSYFPKVEANIIDTSPVTSDTIQDITPAAGEDDTYIPLGGRPTAWYTTGTIGFGQNNDLSSNVGNGTAGLLVQLDHDSVIGGGVLISQNNEDTRLGGDSSVGAVGTSIIGSYEPFFGLRLYGSAAIAKLDIESDRNYLNASNIDSSHGETEGIGYGLAVRAGYEIPIADKATLMPYGEMQWSHSELDGYTETGGAFPAIIADQSGDLLISHIGIESTHQFGPELTFRARGAWGHRLSDDSGVSVSAASITQTIFTDHGDRNWVEGGVGINYNFNDHTTFTADISGRSGRTSEPLVSATVGVVWK